MESSTKQGQEVSERTVVLTATGREELCCLNRQLIAFFPLEDVLRTHAKNKSPGNCVQVKNNLI